MAIKRNIKLYMKEKSSLIAIGCLFLFIITCLISYIPSMYIKKGISDNFENYEITNITTNNYNVTYAVCEKNLFYSQNKTHKSTLNDFANVKEYYNEYGSMRTKEFNFIRIDYEFSSKIIDVKGISDNLLGENGETLILCEDGNLYLISRRNSKVELLLKNVKQVEVQRDYEHKINYYFILHNDNDLSIYYIDNKQMIKQQIYNNDYESFHFVCNKDDTYTFIIKKDNELYKMTTKSIDEYELVENSYSYKIYSNKQINEFALEKLDIKSEKIIRNDDDFYSLYEGKVNKINYKDNEFESVNISCNQYIEDIYTCGENGCIAVCANNSYYYGKIKHHNQSYETFLNLEVEEGKVYSNRNSLILYKNNRLYLFNDEENKFEPMYINYFITYGVRYFSVFVIIMTLFYLILSFCEANKRYNRYFKVNNQ